MRAIVLAILVSGCASINDGGADDDDDIAAAFSPIGQRVIAALDGSHHAMRGHTWDVGTTNELGSNWILQTPSAQYWGQPVAALPVASSCAGQPSCDPDFDLLACTSQADCIDGGTCTPVHATVTSPGAAPRSLCVGHTDAFVDRIYDAVVGAKSIVDLTSLGAPDGRFAAALRNAVTLLAHSGHPVRVRLLYGAVLGDSTVTSDVLASLVRDVPAGSPVRVAVAAYRDTLTSWNHAKMIAVDGALAIVGGNNLWTQHYLQAAPVHDLSLEVRGVAAAQASTFANELWRHACVPLNGTSTIANFPAATSVCDEQFALPPAPATGTVRAITVGRLGTLGDAASDDAMLALVDAAQTTLRLSLQDLGPIGRGSAWPEPYLRALVAAVGRGVDVDLVLSNVGAIPGGLSAGSASYSNGWTPADVVMKLADYAAAHPELLPSGSDVRTLLCAKLHVTALRPSNDDAWPSGAHFANHAKLVIADDAAFYLGSQNWYPTNLFELGYIVDDTTAAHQLVDTYYTPLWTASRRVAVSGSDAPACVL